MITQFDADMVRVFISKMTPDQQAELKSRRPEISLDAVPCYYKLLSLGKAMLPSGVPIKWRVVLIQDAWTLLTEEKANDQAQT